MAPVEAGVAEEEEIEIQDPEAEQDAEPFRIARDSKLHRRKTSKAIDAHTSRSANGAGIVY